MITQIIGKLIEKKEQSLVIDIGGICYEVIVPTSVLERIDETKDQNGNVHLITYYYFQIGPSSGLPVLIGFINEIERDFFLEFIKVSGIGPKAAVKAINQPISEICRGIDDGDMNYLKTLPGIGLQRAKDIVAKLQGKVGKFGLIQDKRGAQPQAKLTADWQEEALSVLLQLQYKRNEAVEMIEKALKRNNAIETAEELLNEIYKQRIKG
jgi:Holliday junction DNA helicase RuvA